MAKQSKNQGAGAGGVNTKPRRATKVTCHSVGTPDLDTAVRHVLRVRQAMMQSKAKAEAVASDHV